MNILHSVDRMGACNWFFLISILIPLSCSADVIDFGGEKPNAYSKLPVDEILCQPENSRLSPNEESVNPHSLSYSLESTTKERRQDQNIYSPDIAVKTPYGWLLGGNRGEWGGEVVLKQDASLAYLLRENAVGIHKMPFGYVVVTGLAHMRVNYGRVYLLRPPLTLSSKPTLLVELPAAPNTSLLLQNNRLLIQLRDSAFVMEQDGALHKVKCINR